MSRPRPRSRPSASSFAALPAVAAVVLAASAAGAGYEVGDPRGRRYPVRFTYEPDRTVGSVALAGSFNGWNRQKTLLGDADGDGVWEAVVSLPRGRHLYKLVIDGQHWIADPTNAERAEDGFGGHNSVAIVGDDGARLPEATRGDAAIARSALVHDPNDPWFRIRWLDDRARLRVRTRPSDVQQVRVVLAASARDERPIAMHRLVATRDGEWFEARIAVPPGRGVRYHFEVTDGETRLFVTPSGVREEAPRWSDRFSLPSRGRKNGPASDELSALERFDTPEWARDAVFYQIFPERFCNGEPRNDPGHVRPWGERPKHDTFFGGDLEGIRSKLDYLHALGVSAIYLNPIFAAVSTHKYDTADYMTVDPAFGDTKKLKQLVDECHERGIRVVLDAVFNHTGDEFWAFEDVKKKGAESRYKDWYFIKQFPIVVKKDPGYECWWGYGDLPKLNTQNPEVRSYLLKVARYWIEEVGIDGWRLDVPNEVPHDFWIEFRRVVKAADPDCLIIGEIWEDATAWLGGDQFDSVMNYPVRKAILDFAVRGEGGPARLDAALAEQRLRYPPQATEVMFNLLGSHDTERVHHVARRDADRVRLAFGLTFAYPGAPVIYYGDEIGLDGGEDPDCRRCFPWDESQWDRQTLGLVKKLAALRKERRALRRGGVRSVFTGTDADGTWAAERAEPGREAEAVIVVANGSSEMRTVVLERSKLAPEAFAGDAAVAELVGMSGVRIETDAEAIRVTLPGRRFAYLAAAE